MHVVPKLMPQEVEPTYAINRSGSEQFPPNLIIGDLRNGDDRTIGSSVVKPISQALHIGRAAPAAGVTERTRIQDDDPCQVQPLRLIAATASSVAPGGSVSGTSSSASLAGKIFMNRSQLELE